MDLSTGFSVNSLTRNHAEAMDLVRKPEWYRRHAPPRATGNTSPLATRRRADGGKPDVALVAPMRPKMEEEVCREGAADCRNATLPSQALGLFRESVHGHLWQAGFYRQPDLTGNAAAAAVDSSSSTGSDSDSGSDVIFLLSASKDSPAACSSSVSRESASPSAAAVALSLDGEGRGCFLLPAALSSASCESSCSSDSSDGSSVIPVHHARPVVLLSDVKVSYGKRSESPINISSGDDEDDESPAAGVAASADEERHRAFAGSGSDKESASDKMAAPNRRGNLRRSPRINMAPAPTAAEFTCRVSQRNLRGGLKCAYEEAGDSEDVMDCINGSSRSSSSSSSSEEEEEEKEEIPLRPKIQRETRETSCSSDDTSDSSSDNSSDSDDPRNGWRRSRSAQSQATRAGRARCKPPPQVPVNSQPVDKKPRPNVCQKPARPLPAPAAARRATPPQKKTAATTGKRRRARKRRRPCSPPPLFPPGEPDILLKYTQLREDRRRKASAPDHFQPFVHMGKRTCTVVNRPEDEGAAGRSPRTAAADPAAPPPGCLPNTSCYRPGRLGPRSAGRPPQTCSLCGRSANAMGLGDLHGPYYPAPDFSQCEVALQGHAPPPGDSEAERWPPATEDAKLRARVKTEGREVGPVGDSDRGHGYDDEEECGEDAKSAVTSVDAPGVLAESTSLTEECWIHEDCGVWATGVFLVKGRLYGLREASRVTRDVVCSGCHESGAIMGCFQKGCMLNYHYRCAISSGCLLNEENFSMKCSKHKNKIFTSATPQQRKS